MEIDGTCWMQLRSRYSLAAQGTDIKGDTIDPDFRGDVWLIVHNDTKYTNMIELITADRDGAKKCDIRSIVRFRTHRTYMSHLHRI